MNRYLLFDTPHKALRLAFSQLLTQAGKTDFTDIKEIVALKNQMYEVFSMVKSHSHHEDDICFTDLDAIVPNATHHDREENERLHTTLDELMSVIKTIIECVKMGQDETTAVRALYTDLCNLHAEMLNHMMEEERDTQPIFWQNMTDEELMAFGPCILSNMTPEMNRLWLRYIIPSKPYNELIGMLTDIKNNAPDFVFESTMALAQEVLTEKEYARLAEVFEEIAV
jgi:iron-sulfur cluster repair protein YtfE (RIC family)